MSSEMLLAIKSRKNRNIASDREDNWAFGGGGAIEGGGMGNGIPRGTLEVAKLPPEQVPEQVIERDPREWGEIKHIYTSGGKYLETAPVIENPSPDLARQLVEASPFGAAHGFVDGSGKLTMWSHPNLTSEDVLTQLRYNPKNFTMKNMRSVFSPEQAASLAEKHYGEGF